MMCNNPPDLGASAIAVVNLGAQSYQKGKVYFADEDRKISNDDPGWAAKWEEMSENRSKPKHDPGRTAGDFGSQLDEPDYMKGGGHWIDGVDPAAS